MVHVLPCYFSSIPFFPPFFVGELEKSQLTAKEDNEKIRSLEGTMWLKSFFFFFQISFSPQPRQSKYRVSFFYYRASGGAPSSGH